MGSFGKRHYETLIVGAGMQGLAYARVCQRLDPDADYLVLDTNSTVGGVWSQERIYPQMHTNNRIGTYEFSDYPTLSAGLEHLGVAPGKHLPGPAVAEYLVRFAEREHITPKLRLRTKVLRAEETEVSDNRGETVLGWALEIERDGQTTQLTCSVLAVATGTCTSSRAVALAGADAFSKPCVSMAQLGTEGAALAADASAKHVVVVGTAKSSYDAVYMYASAGKRVTWAVRKSGHGARYMARPHVFLGPIKTYLEKLLMTRPLTWLSPCVYGPEDGYGWIRSFFHQTRVGNFIVRKFFAQISKDKIALAGFHDDPKFAPLIPRESMLWHATQSGIFNYPTEFLDLVKSDQVSIVEQDIAELQPGGTVVFGDGSKVQTDGLVTATGWEVGTGVPMFPESKHAEWGIPSTSYSDRQRAVWQARHDAATTEVLQRFPVLSDTPIKKQPVTVPCFGSGGELTTRTEQRTQTEIACKTSPWRLFRAIAPPNQAANPTATRNVVFLCTFYSFQAPLRAELAALWAYAYVKRGLRRDPSMLGEDEVWHNTALLGQWAGLRSPFGCGVTMPDVMLDALPYFDMLMRDLGLAKRRGLIGDVFGGYYLNGEWAGIINEWARTPQGWQATGGATTGHVNGHESGQSNGNAKVKVV